MRLSDGEVTTPSKHICLYVQINKLMGLFHTLKKNVGLQYTVEASTQVQLTQKRSLWGTNLQPVHNWGQKTICASARTINIPRNTRRDYFAVFLNLALAWGRLCIPRGLRHQGLWHGHVHINNTHSLETTLAFLHKVRALGLVTNSHRLLFCGSIF